MSGWNSRRGLVPENNGSKSPEEDETGEYLCLEEGTYG